MRTEAEEGPATGSCTTVASTEDIIRETEATNCPADVAEFAEEVETRLLSKTLISGVQFSPSFFITAKKNNTCIRKFYNKTTRSQKFKRCRKYKKIHNIIYYVTLQQVSNEKIITKQKYFGKNKIKRDLF